MESTKWGYFPKKSCLLQLYESNIREDFILFDYEKYLVGTDDLDLPNPQITEKNIQLFLS
jgi:hypothetical protein